jgi:hypothetical protein
MKKLIPFVFIPILLTGCGTFYAAVDSGGDNIFEDNSIIVEKHLDPLQVDLKITNKTNKDMEILWDKCLYVDVTGASYDIIHSGVKFTEDGTIINPQTIIKSKQTHVDFITPIEAIKNREQAHEWKTEMYATHHQTTEQIYIIGEDIDYRNQNELVDLVGKEYNIHLVVRVGSKELTYDLTGKLTDIIDLLKDK